MRITRTTRFLVCLLSAGAAMAGGPGRAAAEPAASAATTCATLGAQPEVPEVYAKRLIAAWSSGDRLAGMCLTMPQVGALIFGEAVKNTTTWRFVREVGGPDEDFRAEVFRNGAGGEMQVFVRLFDGHNTWHRTFQVAFKGTHGRVDTYGDKLIRAWGAGDRKTALRYGTPKAVNALWNFSGGAGGACWKRMHTWGAVGTLIEYNCGSSWVTLTVRPAAAGAGEPQAVIGAGGFH